MAIFKKNDGSVKRQFLESVKDAAKMEEKAFLESLNKTIVNVEKEKSYTTSDKLKIFELFTKLSNCAPVDRQKFINKIARKL
ncbi:MAG: hypothetical protein IKG15_01365 [Solobacterium sp.]|jgi:hypothetical protein|nr:hypothetical protein [Solobacterium sp.]